jgi:type IV secretory pathway TrbL component
LHFEACVIKISPDGTMSRFREMLIGAACLMASCTRSGETSSPSSNGRAGSAIGDDMKGVARESEKTAKDIGRATADFADKAGKRIEQATNEAGGSGDDAWITTKVKSELTTQGFDPLHVHVDTAARVVTLSGTVETAADSRKAVSLAKAVKGVAGVEDHLFVKPNR